MQLLKNDLKIMNAKSVRVDKGTLKQKYYYHFCNYMNLIDYTVHTIKLFPTFICACYGIFSFLSDSFHHSMSPKSQCMKKM